MTRIYTISIRSGKNAPQIADNIPKEFSCVISEPSVWLNPETTERGLTFIDNKGNELDSPLFKHQAYFNSGSEKKQGEESEIEDLVYSVITEHYSLAKGDIKVTITKAGNA